jgi:hypothetical protein
MLDCDCNRKNGAVFVVDNGGPERFELIRYISDFNFQPNLLRKWRRFNKAVKFSCEADMKRV